MLTVLFLVVALAAGFVGGAYWQRRQLNEPIDEAVDSFSFGVDDDRRFAVVYRTGTGSRARQIFERATPKPRDVVEFFENLDQRGRRDGGAR